MFDRQLMSFTITDDKIKNHEINLSTVFFSIVLYCAILADSRGFLKVPHYALFCIVAFFFSSFFVCQPGQSHL